MWACGVHRPAFVEEKGLPGVRMMKVLVWIMQLGHALSWNGGCKLLSCWLISLTLTTEKCSAGRLEGNVEEAGMGPDADETGLEEVEVQACLRLQML